MPRRAMELARFVLYDAADYDFARIVAREALQVPDLPRLHEHYRRRTGAQSIGYSDNLLLRRRLEKLPLDSSFHREYRRFIDEVIAPRFGGHISHSRKPTFRVHMAGTPSISKWHTDEEVTGRGEQINAWVPFVDAFDSNTIWVESHYRAGDYHPVDVMNGEVLLFDGGYLRHGSVANRTGVTRVSMDFRFHSRRDDLPSPDLGILGARPPALRRRR